MTDLYENARILRKNQTFEEQMLWEKLRGKQILGKRFHRQKPIAVYYEGYTSEYIVDFYCRESKLVIELDGNQHECQKKYDEVRTELLAKKGLRVIRFKNKEIRENIELVLIKIKGHIFREYQEISALPCELASREGLGMGASYVLR